MVKFPTFQIFLVQAAIKAALKIVAASKEFANRVLFVAAKQLFDNLATLFSV